MQFVAGCVRNLKIMVMKGLKNYAELYLMNSRFSHHCSNIKVTKFVTVVKLYDSDFWALSQSFEKQLLALSCLSVCLSVCVSAPNNSAPTGRFFVRFENCVFLKICQENSRVIKI
jgi:hypothetical protein